jgi:hypothetical protein
VLLVAFQAKHFICDFPLQTKYHLGKFKPGWDFLAPLASHCGIHAVCTGAISSYAMWYTPGKRGLVLGLVAFDFVCHFVMDRIKAGPKWLGRFNDITQKPYWLALGVDQSWHHCTHYFVIWWLVKAHGSTV